MTTIRVHRYSTPEESADVDVEEGDCVFCIGANQNVKFDGVGDGVFIVRSDTGEIRRVELVSRLGPLQMFRCARVTAVEAEMEIAQNRVEIEREKRTES